MLVATAVIMVPEMFSGPRESAVTGAESVRPAANQIKTYRVELSSSPTAVMATPVEPPAERPLHETQAVQTSSQASEAISPPDQQKPQAVVTQAPEREAAVVVTSVKPAAAKPVIVVPGGNKSTTGGWMVQVGSFSAQDTARQIAANLKELGFPAFVGAVQVNGKTLYRVRVGAMSDRASAEATLQKLRTSYPGASVIAPGR